MKNSHPLYRFTCKHERATLAAAASCAILLSAAASADIITLSVPGPSGTNAPGTAVFNVPSNVVAQIIHAYYGGLYISNGAGSAGYDTTDPTGATIVGPATITLAGYRSGLSFCTIRTSPASKTGTDAYSTSTLALGGTAGLSGATSTFNVPSNVVAQVLYTYLLPAPTHQGEFYLSAMDVIIGGYHATYQLGFATNLLPTVVGPAAIELWQEGQQYAAGLLSFCTICTYSPTSTLGPSLAPVSVTFSAAGDQLSLMWPQDHTGWRLQAQTNPMNAGINTGWVSVSGSTLTNEMALPLSRTNPAVFYRLAYP